MEQKIAPMGFILAGVLFLVAAVVKPLMKGQQLNVAFLACGVIFLILGIAIARKSGGGGAPPPGA